ncbi:ribonuclease H-like domain-containing protein [Tanacetum coccineum]|uniref:Ribonuclease H-like domain-containing protein n=1 Tax=Tanacetum coccineum TaxID=301880 RepID=A0ABQ5H4G2_9ASTR
MMTASDTTTNDLLLKLIGQLGTLGVTTSTNMAQNRSSVPMVNNTSPVAYHTANGPFTSPTTYVSRLPSLSYGLPCRNMYTYNNICPGMLFDPTGTHALIRKTIMVLIQCDNTGYLYPVTSPSPIPQAFLVSQHTWHQRLRHPGSEVMRRLVSNIFISYNREKPLVLCHACQLGKHMRLLFASSNTVVTSCFDIIHSDVWTSPIPSLSDGTLSRHKALLVANTSAQLKEVDVDEVFCHTPRRGLDEIRVRGRDVITIRTQSNKERPLIMDV